MHKILITVFFILAFAASCGTTCQQRVTLTRYGLESAIDVLEPIARAKLASEYAEDWIQATKVVLSLALSEALLKCEEKEAVERAERAAQLGCQLED